MGALQAALTGARTDKQYYLSVMSGSLRVAALALLRALSASTVLAFDYADVAKGYDPEDAPEGFLEFSAAQGVTKPNTCAVRLSYALYLADKNFFKDVEAKSGVEWHGLVVRADDLAIILNLKLGKANRFRSVTRVEGAPPIEIYGKKGIVFFDKLSGWNGGTGHIALWDGEAVVDQSDGGADFFKRGERLYFWPLE